MAPKQVCMEDRSGRTLVLDPDDGPIFKLSDSKTGKGVNLTYRHEPVSQLLSFDTGLVFV